MCTQCEVRTRRQASPRGTRKPSAKRLQKSAPRYSCDYPSIGCDKALVICIQREPQHAPHARLDWRARRHPFDNHDGKRSEPTQDDLLPGSRWGRALVQLLLCHRRTMQCEPRGNWWNLRRLSADADQPTKPLNVARLRSQ